MYQSVEAILQQNDADMGAAEAHGVASGMLCVENHASVDNWLREVFTDADGLPADDRALLLSLYDRTQDLLNPENGSFDFDLFLPDDGESLPKQVEALRCWCQGFLFGVGYSHSKAQWPGDSGEIMQDLIELTKLDSDNAAGEEDENDLAEIREYVRSAVFIVRDQFADNESSQAH